MYLRALFKLPSYLLVILYLSPLTLGHPHSYDDLLLYAHYLDWIIAVFLKIEIQNELPPLQHPTIISEVLLCLIAAARYDPPPWPDWTRRCAVCADSGPDRSLPGRSVPPQESLPV